MAPTWTYLSADLRSNVITADLPLTEVRHGKKLGAAGNLEGQLKLSPRFTGDAYQLTRPGRNVIYALLDGQPWWGGIIWTAGYDSDTGTIRVGCGDFWTYYDNRKLVPLLPGVIASTTVASLSVQYLATDQNEIARQLLALAASHPGGDIGVVPEATMSGISRDRTYYGYSLANIGEALRQLSNVLDGPDMMFDVAGIDAAGRPQRILRLGTPRLGQSGSAHVFEYPGNILSYQWPSDGTRMATRQFAVGEGMEAGQLIAVTEDVDKYVDGWPLLEGEGAYSSVSVYNTLQDHADEDQRASRLPVALPALEVRGNVGEWSCGDDARVVITDQFFPGGLDTTMRIVAIDTSSAFGDKATLTMAPLLEDVA